MPLYNYSLTRSALRCTANAALCAACNSHVRLTLLPSVVGNELQELLRIYPGLQHATHIYACRLRRSSILPSIIPPWKVVHRSCSSIGRCCHEVAAAWAGRTGDGRGYSAVKLENPQRAQVYGSSWSYCSLLVCSTPIGDLDRWDCQSVANKNRSTIAEYIDRHFGLSRLSARYGQVGVCWRDHSEPQSTTPQPERGSTNCNPKKIT